ncbi:MAG: glutathione peroxidase [Alphaproteobacteria bacterium]
MAWRHSAAIRLSCVLAVALAVLVAVLPARGKPMNAHDFAFRSIDGAALPLREFAGHPILIVNTASECGFTPQYAGLQALWEKERAHGLIVLGVPSNDFGGQEPGRETEIKAFCELNYGIDFPMTEKQAVIGPDAHPFYRWIADTLGADLVPQWNFHKYLIDPEGEIVASWPSRVTPNGPELQRALAPYLGN